MSKLRQINLKARHSPYWVTVYETHDGIYMEDIFSAKDKKPALEMKSWEDAITEATGRLDKWENQLEGFENYIRIYDAGWTDIVIAGTALSRLYSEEAEHLKKLLASTKYFDTGEGWADGGCSSLRVLAVADCILLQVSQKLPSTETLIGQCVSSEDEAELSDELIEEISAELENHSEYTKKVTEKRLIRRNSDYQAIMNTIETMERSINSRMERVRKLCHTITQNYLKGSLACFSVIVKIPNRQQRGLIVSARTTTELFEKIARQINLGPDATIIFSQILTEDDVLVDNDALSFESAIGDGSQFQWEDVTFSDEILESDGKLNFYVPVTFDYVAIFGTVYALLGENPNLNVYAAYDLERNKICDRLTIVIKYPEGEDETRYYRLNTAEKDIFLQKMNAYCKEQTGKDLSRWDEAE